MYSRKQDTDYYASDFVVQLAFFEFSTGAPHPLSIAHTVSLPPLYGIFKLSTSGRAEVLGDHVLISMCDGWCKAIVYLVSWKTGIVTFVSGFSKFCLGLDSPESRKLRGLPLTRLDYGHSIVVSINSSLVLLIEDTENRLEVCKLELGPGPQLQTLCFLELPPLAPGAVHYMLGPRKDWVPTSKSYTWTRSSRGYHLPFYTSRIGTIVIDFQYRLQLGQLYQYALMISVEALIASIPTDVRNVPWEDWGPSSTHFFKMATKRLTSVGPFWITECPSLVLRQYDIQHTRYTQFMAGDQSLLQPRPPIVDSTNIFQYDIKTHLSYRDVTMQNKDLCGSSYIIADREWVIAISNSVRFFLST
jgi:hypothetical protein